MTVDREQIRRDAEAELDCYRWDQTVDSRTLADHCLALLAELEQAQKERDEALDTSPLRIASAELRRLEPLVAQVRKTVQEWHTGSTPMADLAEALDKWERE